MSRINKLDAYTKAAHAIRELPEGWAAHEAKLPTEHSDVPGRIVTGAVFKPYRRFTTDRPSWSRRIAGTAGTIFISDALLDQAMSELKAAAKAKRDARFTFMFIVADDEADAADFLCHTIFPDFYAYGRMISAKQAWHLIQKWGGAKVKTARMDRIISLALDAWNTRAGEMEAEERAKAREVAA